MNIKILSTLSQGTIFLLLIILLAPFYSSAQGTGGASFTEVTTDITIDTVWTVAESPYVVGRGVSVASSTTLTIEPGVVVKIREGRHVFLNIEGSLIAEGTPSEPIYFTSIHDDTVSGDTNENGTSTTPAASDWRDIIFSPGSSGQLTNVIVRYGGYFTKVPLGPSFGSGASLHNNGGTLTIENSTISHGNFFNIGQSAGSITIRDSVISEAKGGVVSTNGDVTLENTTVSDHDGDGVYSSGSGTLTLTGNTFESNASWAAAVYLSDGLVLVNESNTASNNDVNGVRVSGTIAENQTWAGNTMPYIVCACGSTSRSGAFSTRLTNSITVDAASTLTLASGAVVKFRGGKIAADGTLVAEGTKDARVYFTSIHDDTVGGDTGNDGNTEIPTARDWDHLVFPTGSVGTIDYAVLRYGGDESRSTLYNTGGTLAVTNSEFSNNDIYVFHHGAGTTSVTNSYFHDNPEYGVYNTSGNVVDARNNYWDTPTGPFHSSNPGGTGNQVSDNVLFDPWLTEDPFAEPAIDPLILQYEPILYLHPDETYKPMNVEAFVEASALWESDVLFDDLLIPRGGVTIEDIGAGGSDEWYLAFSGNEARSFDPVVASTTYKALVSSGDAKTTYYAYKTEDSYTDSSGTHEFIVLQYWYFYAFNDWAEHGGRNNHEGDWESVFVFLDKDTEEPMYVAYSSHLNDGEAELLNRTQYDSVRRDWAVAQKDGDNVKSFVALGSHANYPRNNTHIVPNPNPVEEDFQDETSGEGDDINTENWSQREVVDINDPSWMRYEGKWGANTAVLGENGPHGPYFIDVNFFTDLKRFQEPVKWAGVDKARGKHVVLEPVTTPAFPNQNTTMYFTNDLDVGTTISVDLHDELISFGERESGVILLPHFWDLESSLENGTFEVEVEFGYDAAEVELWGVAEENLTVFFYNETINTWEPVPSSVNTQTSTISFTTTHFSRYAIGEKPAGETPTTEALIQEFRDTLATSTLSTDLKNKLNKQMDKLERFITREKIGTALRRVDKIAELIEKETRRENIDSETSEELLDLLRQIRETL